MKDNNLIERNYYKEFFKKTLKSPSFIVPFSVLTILFVAGFIFSKFINPDSYLNINLEKQFIAPSLQFISNWKEEMEKDYTNEIRLLFGEKALTFSSIMEKI